MRNYKIYFITDLSLRFGKIKVPKDTIPSDIREERAVSGSGAISVSGVVSGTGAGSSVDASSFVGESTSIIYTKFYYIRTPYIFVDEDSININTEITTICADIIKFNSELPSDEIEVVISIFIQDIPIQFILPKFAEETASIFNINSGWLTDEGDIGITYMPLPNINLYLIYNITTFDKWEAANMLFTNRTGKNAEYITLDLYKFIITAILDSINYKPKDNVHITVNYKSRRFDPATTLIKKQSINKNLIYCSQLSSYDNVLLSYNFYKKIKALITSEEGTA